MMRTAARWYKPLRPRIRTSSGFRVGRLAVRGDNALDHGHLGHDLIGADIRLRGWENRRARAIWRAAMTVLVLYVNDTVRYRDGPATEPVIPLGTAKP
jgi:hypothetical protein